MTGDQKKAINFIFFAVVFFIVVIFFRMRADKIERDYQFSGIVQSIVFGDKRIPKVTINGESYFLLSSKEDFNDQIKPGDSLMKNKNFKIYKLLKKNSHEVIVSK